MIGTQQQRLLSWPRLGLALVTAFVVGGCDSASTESEPSAGAQPDRRAEADAHLAADNRIRECLDGQGFTTRSTADGGWEFDIPAGGEGQAAADRALDDCVAQADAPPPIQPTDEELSKLYDALVNSENCLRENGWDVDPAPSREVFVEDYPSLDGGEGMVDEPPWSPYLSVPDFSLETAMETCPQPDPVDL